MMQQQEQRFVEERLKRAGFACFPGAGALSSDHSGSGIGASSSSGVGVGVARKKQRGPSQPQVAPVCQVEGCNMDLRGSKGYHRRHRVCEVHSKTPKSVVDGIEKRFCQQCSRFHVLEEFDDGKRSCRKRLAGHNERRRKPTQLVDSGLAIVSGGKLGIFPGDFKPAVPTQQHHHLLDGSFLSNWPDQSQQHPPHDLKTPAQIYQGFLHQQQHQGAMLEISQQHQQLFQFLKSSSGTTTASFLPGSSPPPCSDSSQCGALSLLSAGQRSLSPTPSAAAPSSLPAPSCSSSPGFGIHSAINASSSNSSSSNASVSGSDLYRRSHLDSLLQIPQFFVQGSAHGLDMLVHSRSSFDGGKGDPAQM